MPEPTRDELWQILAAIVVQAEGKVVVSERALVEASGKRLTVVRDVERQRWVLTHG